MQTSNWTMAEIKNINESPGVQNSQQSFHHTGVLADANSKSLQLTGILQSALELNKILELFSDEISSVVAHDGLSYVNRDENYAISFGETALHSCSYQLVLLDKYIGELTFNRQKRFSDKEIKQLETLIAALIYPLRNALLYKQAVEKAHRDPVTGVGNRAAMDNAVEQELDLAIRHGTPLSMILLDIDKFKQINDTYGHIAGDAVLKRVADCMIESMRRSDIIYRYGGEEFVILLRTTHELGAKLLAERIRKSVESMHFKYDNFKIKVTVSAGLTSLQDGDDASSLLDRCDHALYEAKESGRNCVVISEAEKKS